jgi:hypothetical protein
MVQGAAEYLAPPDEIKRLGWKARRLVRVRPPPPLTQSFAERVRSSEMSRGEDERGGPNRRFMEDRQGGKGFTDSSGWRRQEDEFRREQQLRDRAMRGDGRLQYEGGEDQQKR